MTTDDVGRSLVKFASKNLMASDLENKSGQRRKVRRTLLLAAGQSDSVPHFLLIQPPPLPIGLLATMLALGASQSADIAGGSGSCA